MKTKGNKTVFIYQVTENYLKVVKCLLSAAGRKGEVLELEVEPISWDLDDKKLSEKILQLFRKLGYNNQPVILSLPRNFATCRYIKIPSQLPQEIEKIATLQASRYLPYPANELVTAHQIIQSSPDGGSYINLIIAHKNAIERYIKIFRELKISEIAVILSSYGLYNLLLHLRPEDTTPVMLVDIDTTQVELVITASKKLLFTRSFKPNKQQARESDILVEEINKTRDIYLKEVSEDLPAKIILTGPEKACLEAAGHLGKAINIPVEILSFGEKINLRNEAKGKLQSLDTSLSSIIGQGLGNLPDSVNLLPADLKNTTRRIAQRKEVVKAGLLLLVTALILTAVIAKNLNNKAVYLEQLKIELNKISKEAKSLDEIEKRFQLLEGRAQQKLSSLDILHELYKIIPPQIYLVNFSYEEGNQISLRGQTVELNSVFTFLSQMEKSPVFSNFNVKIRYATQKKSQSGEIVDFEINGSKK